MSSKTTKVLTPAELEQDLQFLVGCFPNRLVYSITHWELRFDANGYPNLLAGRFDLQAVDNPDDDAQSTTADEAQHAARLASLVVATVGSVAIQAVQIDAHGNIILAFQDGTVLVGRSHVEEQDWGWELAADELGWSYHSDGGAISKVTGS